MKEYIKKKVLITTENWFYAPDGRQYKSVYGTLNGIHESSNSLGFTPNRAHANWFIEIGNMIIMGCQVMYVVRADEINTGDVMEWTSEITIDGDAKKYKRPSAIYVTS